MRMMVGKWGCPAGEESRKGRAKSRGTKEAVQSASPDRRGAPGGGEARARFWKPSWRGEEAQTPGERERRIMERRINGNDGTVTVRARDLRGVADTLVELKPFRKV